MNLAEIPNSPLSDQDIESYLRLLLEGLRRGVSISSIYHPHFQLTPKWEVTVYLLDRPISQEGETLELAVERVFERLQEEDRLVQKLAEMKGRLLLDSSK